MRRRLEDGLRALWAGETGPMGALVSVGLVPFELLYAGGVAVRNRLYDSGLLPTIPADLPVVSVGNVLVGGAGKTPVSAWLARMLADRDRGPAIVTRGYGEDEVALHRRWNPDVPVVVEPDRVRGAGAARDAGATTVVLDDGFQHRRIGRDLDIVVHAAEAPEPERLLPRGPYREPLTSLGRADHVIITRRTAPPSEAVRLEARLKAAFPELPVCRIHLKPSGWVDLDGEETDPPSGPLLAVTAIARPRSFARLAERVSGSPVELMSFPDHHSFSPKESDEIRQRALGMTVVTTEKDAARLAGTAHPFGESARVLRLEVECEAGMERLERAFDAATESADADESRPGRADPEEGTPDEQPHDGAGGGGESGPGSSPREPGGRLGASSGGEAS